MKELKFLRNKVADKIVKPFKEIFIPPEQIEEIKTRMGMRHCKISKLLNDSSASKFVAKKNGLN